MVTYTLETLRRFAYSTDGCAAQGTVMGASANAFRRPLGFIQGEELNAVLGERAVRIGRSVRMDSHWYIPYHCITVR